MAIHASASLILKDIIEQSNALKIHEKRSLGEDFYEIVFYNIDIDKWNKLFTDILGPAIKPAGVRPAKKDFYLTKDYGSIRDDQTIFKKEFDGFSVVAMFWPWQDNTHTTLKLYLIKR